MDAHELRIFSALLAHVRGEETVDGHQALRWTNARRGNCDSVYRRGEYVGHYCCPSCLAWQSLIADATQIVSANSAPVQLRLLGEAS